VRKILRIVMALLISSGTADARATVAAAPPSIIPRCEGSEHADADHHPDDFADAAAGDCDVDYAISANFDRAAFSAAGDGTQTAPSNQVLLALSLFLTTVLVAPLGSQIYNEAWQPMENGSMTPPRHGHGHETAEGLSGRYVREKDVKLFLDITHAPAPHAAADLDLTVLAPAYMLSEMRAGFRLARFCFCLSCWWILWWRR